MGVTTERCTQRAPDAGRGHRRREHTDGDNLAGWPEALHARTVWRWPTILPVLLDCTMSPSALPPFAPCRRRRARPSLPRTRQLHASMPHSNRGRPDTHTTTPSRPRFRTTTDQATPSMRETLTCRTGPACLTRSSGSSVSRKDSRPWLPRARARTLTPPRLRHRLRRQSLAAGATVLISSALCGVCRGVEENT